VFNVGHEGYWKVRIQHLPTSIHRPFLHGHRVTFMQFLSLSLLSVWLYQLRHCSFRIFLKSVWS